MTVNCPECGDTFETVEPSLKGHLGALDDHPNWSDLDEKVQKTLLSDHGEAVEGDPEGSETPSEGDPADPPEDPEDDEEAD
jgi:transcription elongation factor Elf1